MEEVAGKEALPSNTWSHLAFTYDGEEIHLYVDGKLVASESAPNMQASSGPLLIGENQYGHFFKGTIDEIRLYGQALDEAQIGEDEETRIGLPLRVIHAKIYGADPAEGGKLIAEEWAQPALQSERRQTSRGIETRTVSTCHKQDEEACAVKRFINSQLGVLQENAEPSENTVNEVAVPVKDQENLSDPATLMLPRRSSFGESIESGDESEVASPWQVLPPGHGKRFELIRSAHPEEDETPEESWSFWIDSDTRLPIKAVSSIGGSEPVTSYYSYDTSPPTTHEIPLKFFLPEPVSHGAGCTTNGVVGGWKFTEAGAVFADPRAPSIVNTADGPLLLTPKGQATDWPGGANKTLTSSGLSLSSAAQAEENLEWEVTFEEQQSLETAGGVVYVVASSGERVAAIRSTSGIPSVVDGEDEALNGAGSGDLIIVEPNSESVEILPAQDSGSTDQLCLAQNSATDAMTESLEEDAEARAEYFAVASSSGSTAQIKVWVNPHNENGVGNVQVTVQGPCTDHQKFIGSDGQATFGGCSVGQGYTVSVPENVVNNGRHFRDSQRQQSFTLGKAGNVVTFDYSLISEESPPPPPPPPSEESPLPTLAVGEIDAEPNSEEDEEATISGDRGMPAPIEIEMNHALQTADCAAEGFSPHHIQLDGAPATSGGPWYVQCKPFTILDAVLLHVTLEAYLPPNGILHPRDELGKNGEGVSRPTAPIEMPEFGGPYPLRDKCKGQLKLVSWLNRGALWGLLSKPPWILISAGPGHARGLYCQ